MLEIAYRSFGRTPPAGLPRHRLAVVWLLSSGFVVAGLAATLVLNFFSLFAGVMILFVNRPRADIRFLRLFGKVPAIVPALAALAVYALWHQSRLHGLWMMIWPMFAIWISGAIMIGLCALWGARSRT